MVYRLIEATGMGNVFGDPFLFQNRSFGQAGLMVTLGAIGLTFTLSKLMEKSCSVMIYKHLIFT